MFSHIDQQFLNNRSTGFLLLFPFLATALYNLSFTAVATAGAITISAFHIGIAAALSWCFFGVLLHWAGRLPIGTIFLLCLDVMFRGNLVLLLSVVLNLCAPFLQISAISLVIWHSIILLAANLVMALRFCRLIAQAGLGLRKGILYWMAGQNGIFAVVLVLLIQYGGPL
ncbi:MAG: hypothetical protein ACO1QB_09570 [Verrucomicrobiales bacterium]